MATKEITFHYTRNLDHRTYHVDGAFGGITPSGHIFADLFVERRATPDMVVQEVSEVTGLGKEIRRSEVGGIVREIECTLIMNGETAKNLHAWLSKKLKDFELLTAEVARQQQKTTTKKRK